MFPDQEKRSQYLFGPIAVCPSPANLPVAFTRQHTTHHAIRLTCTQKRNGISFWNAFSRTLQTCCATCHNTLSPDLVATACRLLPAEVFSGCTPETRHSHPLPACLFPSEKTREEAKSVQQNMGKKTAGSPSSAHCRAEKSSLHKNPLLLCPLARVGTKVRTSETFRTLRSLRILCLLFSRLHRRTRSSVPGFLPRWEHSPALSHRQVDDVQRCLEADGA